MTRYLWSNGEEHDDPEHLHGWIPLDGRSILPHLWRYLFERYQPKSMLDLGGGEGWAALWFVGRGVDAFCIDGSVEAQAADVLPSGRQGRFIRHDFTQSNIGLMACVPGPWDLIYSVEFVEHVEEQYLPGILELFSRARVVAMSAAWKDAPGHHHVNCQNQPYWVDRLASIGFKLDEQATRESRALPQVQQRDAYWGRTGCCFIRE